MIYHPPKADKSADAWKSVSVVMGAASSAAVPIAGAIGGGVAAGAAGASVIGGIGAGVAGATIGTAATTATLGTASTLAASAGAAAATGIGIPVAIALGVAAAGAGLVGALDANHDKKEAADYETMYNTKMQAKQNAEQSTEQNYYNNAKGYNQNGINSSISAIEKMTTFSSSLIPSRVGTEINNNRLI